MRHVRKARHVRALFDAAVADVGIERAHALREIVDRLRREDRKIGAATISTARRRSKPCETAAQAVADAHVRRGGIRRRSASAASPCVPGGATTTMRPIDGARAQRRDRALDQRYAGDAHEGLVRRARLRARRRRRAVRPRARPSCISSRRRRLGVPSGRRRETRRKTRVTPDRDRVGARTFSTPARVARQREDGTSPNPTAARCVRRRARSASSAVATSGMLRRDRPLESRCAAAHTTASKSPRCSASSARERNRRVARTRRARAAVERAYAAAVETRGGRLDDERRARAAASPRP